MTGIAQSDGNEPAGRRNYLAINRLAIRRRLFLVKYRWAEITLPLSFDSQDLGLRFHRAAWALFVSVNRCTSGKLPNGAGPVR